MAAGGRSPSLWERVCAEYEAEQPQFPDVPGSKHGAVSLEAGISQPFHTEQFYSVPAADSAVQELLPIAEAAAFPDPPDPKTCSPTEYLEYYIFPVLLPGMVELMHQAEKEKGFEPEALKQHYVNPKDFVAMKQIVKAHGVQDDNCFRKRTKFIACDFLTEWLYNKNPKRKDESFTEFFSIPFVKDWLKDRPPVPLSLLLSEEEASIVIQSFWRGYRVRCDSKVQELRQWQKQLRDEKNIIKIVEGFWMKQEAKAVQTRPPKSQKGSCASKATALTIVEHRVYPTMAGRVWVSKWEANGKTRKNTHKIIQQLGFSFLMNTTSH